MRFSIVVLLLTTILFSCENKNQLGLKVSEINTSKPTVIANITFDEEEFDFGIIDEGDVVTHEFSFVNDSENELLITDAKASCGCTVPKYPKRAISPGGSGVVEVRFNSSRKPGMQRKSITIFANVDTKMKVLKIRSQVIPESEKGLGPLKDKS